MIENMSIFSGSKPTDVDRGRYEQLRQVVSLGLANFRKTGLALAEIRDRQLWRFDCESFADCCRRHWEISERHAQRLIEAAAFCEELGPSGSLVTSERQVRSLKTMPPEDLAGAIEEASAAHDPAAGLRLAISKRRPKKTKIRPARYEVPGAVVTITPNTRYRGLVETLQEVLRREVEEKRPAA